MSHNPIVDIAEESLHLMMKATAGFVVTKLGTDPALSNGTGPSKIEMLVEEAWIVFLLPMLETYRTWILDGRTGDGEREHFDGVIETVKTKWFHAMGQAEKELRAGDFDDRS